MQNYIVRIIPVFELEAELNTFDEQGYAIRELFEYTLNQASQMFVVVAQRFAVTMEPKPTKSTPAEKTVTRAATKKKL